MKSVSAETLANNDDVANPAESNAISEVLRLTPDDWKSVLE